MLPGESKDAGQSIFTPERIDYLRRQYAKDSTPEEFEHFVSVCRTRGLNPEANQIYWSKIGGRAQIMLSISAFRLIAHRTGLYGGGTKVVYEWSADDPKKPESASKTVKRWVQGQWCDWTGTVFFDEKYRPSRDGKKSHWDLSPRSMLAKCAEADALRQAFPEELAGFYTPEEMPGPDTEQESQAEPRSAPQPAADIVVTSDLKVRDWIQMQLQQASVPQTEWADIVDSLNGYTKKELIIQLKKTIADRTLPGAVG